MNYKRVLTESMEHHAAQHKFVFKYWGQGKTPEQTLCAALEMGFKTTKSWIKDEWAELEEQLQEGRFNASLGI